MTRKPDLNRAGDSPASMVNRKFVSSVWREEFIDLAQALHHGHWRQQWIVALTTIVVIEVEGQRGQIDGDCVRKRCAEELVSCLLLVSACARRLPSELVCVKTGFAPDVGFYLLPHQVSKILRDASTIDERVANVDEKLKGN